MLYKTLSLLALSGVLLIAQNKPLSTAPANASAPIIDERHQNEVLKLNNKILLLENQIQKTFGDQIKEIDTLKQQLGQELAAICGEKFEMRMDKDSAVCVPRQSQANVPTAAPKTSAAPAK